MRKFIDIITESVNPLPVVPTYFYRASEIGVRSAYLTKIFRIPGDLPPEVEHALSEVGATRAHGLSYNMPWKISREYSGMSNWGFGIYFASDLEWTRRYGDCVTVVKINPDDIYAINHRNFIDETEGTAGGELHNRLSKAVPDRSMREEAAIMSKVVKSIKKTAKALYVDVGDNRGQICVFSPAIISPVCYAEIPT